LDISEIYGISAYPSAANADPCAKRKTKSRFALCPAGSGFGNGCMQGSAFSPSHLDSSQKIAQPRGKDLPHQAPELQEAEKHCILLHALGGNMAQNQTDLSTLKANAEVFFRSHGLSYSDGVNALLTDAKPANNIRAGATMAAIARRNGLTNDDVLALEKAIEDTRDKEPVEPLRL
jgi:hypothetical protein